MVLETAARIGKSPRTSTKAIIAPIGADKLAA